MGCVTFSSTTMIMAGFKYKRQSKNDNSCSCVNLKTGHIGEVTILKFQPTFPYENHRKFSKIPRLLTSSRTQYNEGSDPEENSVEDLRVPNHWSDPSKASAESEWLRVSLHKWLDDEYCPEETNIKISEVASQSFYKSLMEKKTDLGEILLEMVQELSSISYQESFHGAFSSANAAVNLIIQRIQQD